MRVASLLLLGLLTGPLVARGQTEPSTGLDVPADARFVFGGEVGRRIEVNIDQWLLPAPQANPGMLAMFRRRDRLPPPRLVPWAGEFVGKYLLSALGALRESDDPRLEPLVRDLIDKLLACQADDGYLGPFPKAERLLGHWDLWGHYHVMLALLRWHEQTGDARALAACRKMADLVCRTYLDGHRRVLDAGSPEMNMAILHGLAGLQRIQRSERDWAMMRAIEEDWRKAGDYFRTGLDGIDFFRTPRPRWESLHDVQGLAELYRLTGDQRYRDAFLSHWRSIRRSDRHNSGGFSTGEQACGDPYEPGAIETCCTIAWMALTIDALRLTADPSCADELELSTYNAMLGAQHPSGRWWTYSTPMDGVREASAHAIVFQARAGTPELNCCSVNGPRGLGMLADWSLMNGPKDVLFLNQLGPMRASTTLPDGTPVTIETRGRYPIDGDVTIAVAVAKPTPIALAVRVPGFSTAATIELPGEEPRRVGPGYVRVDRSWRPGESIKLHVDLPVRIEAGDRACAGRGSVFRGPLLLAFDPALNDFDAEDLPTIRPDDLSRAQVVTGDPDDRTGELGPMLRVEIPLADGRVLRLGDFASAGASGTPYRTWLPAEDLPPAPPLPLSPVDGGAVPRGPIAFSWRPSPLATETTYRIMISDSDDPLRPIVTLEQTGGHRQVLPADRAKTLEPGRFYVWTLFASNEHGETKANGPPRRFRIDPDRTSPTREEWDAPGDGPVFADRLMGQPAGNRLESAEGVSAANGPDGESNQAVETDGRSAKVIYHIPGLAEWDYSVAVRVRVGSIPEPLGQIFCAWTAPGDDPLRLVVDGGRLSARIEAGGGGFTTQPPYPVEVGRWLHVAAVKQGGRLRLYVDGREVASGAVPASVHSGSTAFALGGNPRYPGNEHLAARFSDLRIYDRALTGEEVAGLSRGEAATPR